MKQSKKMRMIKALILLSILLALSGMVVTVSADGFPLRPNQFYGTVMINGEPAPDGTIITAYIDDELKRSVETTTAGEYGDDLNYLDVTGGDSDNGRTIIFEVAGVLANEHATWNWYAVPRRLDLSTGVGASRDLPDDPVEAGAEFEVSISQTDFFVVGTVTEVLPIGYAYVDGSATDVDDAVYTPGTRTLVLTIDSGVPTVTYRVTAGTADGTFTGTYVTEDVNGNPVTGDVTGESKVFIKSDDITSDDPSSDDTSSPGGASGGMPKPESSPTVTPDGATSAPDESVTPDSPEATETSTEAPTSTTADESRSGGLLTGYGLMLVIIVAIIGLLVVIYLGIRKRE